jgi:Tfp pilus assembly protein PilN
MRPANLLPPDLAREGGARLPGGPAIAAVGAGAAVGILLTGGFIVEHGKVSKRQDELASLKAQLAAIPAPKPAKVQVSPELSAERDARQAALDQALATRTAWDTVFRELSLVLPDDVWLRSLSAKSSAAAAASTDQTASTTPTGLVMNGYTYSQEGVARLLTRLALVPHLANVTLQSSSSSTIGARSIVGFTIGADVTATGGGS